MSTRKPKQMSTTERQNEWERTDEWMKQDWDKCFLECCHCIVQRWLQKHSIIAQSFVWLCVCMCVRVVRAPLANEHDETKRNGNGVFIIVRRFHSIHHHFTVAHSPSTRFVILSHSCVLRLAVDLVFVCLRAHLALQSTVRQSRINSFSFHRFSFSRSYFVWPFVECHIAHSVVSFRFSHQCHIINDLRKAANDEWITRRKFSTWFSRWVNGKYRVFVSRTRVFTTSKILIKCIFSFSSENRQNQFHKTKQKPLNLISTTNRTVYFDHIKWISNDKRWIETRRMCSHFRNEKFFRFNRLSHSNIYVMEFSHY